MIDVLEQCSSKRIEVLILNNNLSIEKKFSLKAILPIVLTIAIAMLLVMMDSTVMNVAIPNLQKVFHTDLATIQWTVTGYTLALAVMTPLSG